MTTFDLGPADLADGAIRAATAGDRELAVARLGDRHVAFELWCPHDECPLSDGWLEGSAIRCACHGALFDLDDGTPIEGPTDESIDVFPAAVDSEGRIVAEIPILPA